jgi:hypothetical protein
MARVFTYRSWFSSWLRNVRSGFAIFIDGVALDTLPWAELSIVDFQSEDQTHTMRWHIADLSRTADFLRVSEQSRLYLKGQTEWSCKPTCDCSGSRAIERDNAKKKSR